MAVTPDVVWTSGTQGTVLRTVDAGTHWQVCPVPAEAASLDFRGIWAWSKKEAMVMSSGPGPGSRLYRTEDGCRSWQLLFSNPDPTGFWDALVFSHNRPQNGVLLGDPVEGRFTLFRTADRGEHWAREAAPTLASAPQGEGAFAASNTSLAMPPSTGDLIFGTGGLGGPRLFRFASAEHLWRPNKLAESLKGTETFGIFSLAFRTARQGIAVGGDYKKPANRESTAFLTENGGSSWTPAATPPQGYRSAVAWDRSLQLWIAVGPTGADASSDGGRTWKLFDQGSWNAISPPWVVGPKGQIGHLAAALH